MAEEKKLKKDEAGKELPEKTLEDVSGGKIPGWLDWGAPWLKDVEASAKQGEQA